MTKDNIECLGCMNIQKSHFPFRHYDDAMGHYMDRGGRSFLDAEGCWDGYHGEPIEVFYCPVCGRKLSELNRG